MPFVKGQSGNPKGQIRDKVWHAALRSGLYEKDPKTKKRKLDLVAQAVIQAAMEGDMQAAKEIGDRLDGKAPQASEDSGTPDNPFNVLFKWAAAQP